MNKLIQRMSVVYGKPEHTDAPAFFAELARLMKSYCEEELDKAADVVIRGHKGKTWPAVSVMLAACAEAREILHLSAQADEDAKHPEWSKRARFFAFKSLRSEMGRRAAKEGWILGLEKFLRENMREPSEREIGDLKRSGRGFDDAYGEVLSGRGGAVAPALKRLGNTMLERRNELAAVAHGDFTFADKVLKRKASA
jgi:hypothetical protein